MGDQQRVIKVKRHFNTEKVKKDKMEMTALPPEKDQWLTPGLFHHPLPLFQHNAEKNFSTDHIILRNWEAVKDRMGPSFHAFWDDMKITSRRT